MIERVLLRLAVMEQHWEVVEAQAHSVGLERPRLVEVEVVRRVKRDRMHSALPILPSSVCGRLWELSVAVERALMERDRRICTDHNHRHRIARLKKIVLKGEEVVWIGQVVAARKRAVEAALRESRLEAVVVLKREVGAVVLKALMMAEVVEERVERFLARVVLELEILAAAERVLMVSSRMVEEWVVSCRLEVVVSASDLYLMQLRTVLSLVGHQMQDSEVARLESEVQVELLVVSVPLLLVS